MGTSRLPPFDPSRDFVTLRKFRCFGVHYVKDQPFELPMKHERLLRRLYEARHIGYAPEEAVRSDEAPKTEPTQTPAPAAPPSPAPSAPAAKQAPWTEEEKQELVDDNLKKDLVALATNPPYEIEVQKRWTKRDIVDAIAEKRDGPADG